MWDHVFHAVRELTTTPTGWGAIVESMENAFSDPKHVIILGIAVVIIVVVYVNYRVAKWLENQAEHYHEHHDQHAHQGQSHSGKHPDGPRH